MATSVSDSKVLIIGAGPGGLVLAQILRGQGIPFEIFERDPTLTSRKQGWAVSLIECLPDLFELLPTDLGDLAEVSVNYGLAPFDTLGVINAVTGESIAKLADVPRGEPGFSIRANREHFRQWLLKNLDIKLDKNFTHYEEDRDGVTAHFADGTSARGSILIGVEGGHSHVRRQLLGEEGASLVPSAYIPIISETTVPYEQFEYYHKLGSAALLANKPDLRFLIGLLESLDGGKNVRFYSAVCFKSDEPARDAAWSMSAGKQELFDTALEKLHDVQPHLVDVFRKAGPEAIASPGIKFEEFVPPPTLPRGRVTLMGDAAHTMIPFRGAGANTAVRDACLMAKLLIEEKNRSGTADVHWVLQQYDSVMLPRGKEQVLASRAAGEDMMGPARGRV